MAQFKPNRKKIVEALVFIATQRPMIDVFHVNKTLFYADREHLLKYGRTITGDTYYAMDDGPVPHNAYNIARHREQFVSAEILAYADERLVRDESFDYVRLTAKTEFDDSAFSRTDIECLRESIDRYAGMDFLELYKLVHKEKAWNDYYSGKGTSTQIPIESLVPEDLPDRGRVIEQLREQVQYTEI